MKRQQALVLGVTAVLAAGGVTAAGAGTLHNTGAPWPDADWEVQSLDGSGNNLEHPHWGRLGQPYRRVAEPNYADGIGTLLDGPNPRWISNRIINDANQNVFSETGVTQWLWTWGQFLDHTFALARSGDEKANIPFDRDDPLEEFRNDLPTISFTRNAVARGTGEDEPRQQVNTLSSYIDAYAVYGASPERLDWLRAGDLDGDPTNNDAELLLPDGYLPTSADRDGADLPGPQMDVEGRLRGRPDTAVVAGDQRANENIALTATHTLFAREHNRIVDALPDSLSAEEKFQVARKVIIAEQQFITYREFLPAAGVRLPAYRGYDPDVETTVTNEFATVGYRAHSQIHGEFEIEVEADHYSPARLTEFRTAGIKIEPDGDELALAIPLNVAFFNPKLLRQVGLGETLKMLGGEAQYSNDTMIDNQLRSVLFQIPRDGRTRCIEPVDPACFSGVTDLGAIDIARGRDHGMPTYNDLREAYGLERRQTFRAITGEDSDSFDEDPQLTPGEEIDDPDALDFTGLFDKFGAPIGLDSPAATAQATTQRQRTTIAARLRAVYGDVDAVDAFVGMIAEPHVEGSEFGELQLAIWAEQFRALRDGDRFFYRNSEDLAEIRSRFGIDFRRTLAQVIADNTEVPAAELRKNVFIVPQDEPLDPGRILAVDSGQCLTGPTSAPPAEDPSAPPAEDPPAPPAGDPSGPAAEDPSAPAAEGPSGPAAEDPSAPPADNADDPISPASARGSSDVPTAALDDPGLALGECDAEDPGQGWNQHADGTIHLTEDQCLDLAEARNSEPGTPVVVVECTGEPTQRWRFRADGRIRNRTTNLCLTADEGAVVAERCRIRSPAQRWLR